MSSTVFGFGILSLAAILIGNLYILVEIYKVQIRIDNKLYKQKKSSIIDISGDDGK